MTVELITGRGGDNHIGSEDFGEYQACTFGPGRYILSGCGASVVDANTVRVDAGNMLLDGRHARVKGSEDVAIQSGAVGRNRKDLICIRYTKDKDGIEDSPLAVIVGTPVEGDPQAPSHIKGSIRNGDVAVDIPVFEVTVTGLSVAVSAPLLEKRPDLLSLIDGKADKSHGHSAANITSGTLPVSRGGTGVTTDKEIALKSWPVGSVYLSFSATSPASLFGGTWSQISGRFLRAASDVSTGGADTHTLSVSQMPVHNHAYSGGTWLMYWSNGYAAVPYQSGYGGMADSSLTTTTLTQVNAGGGQAHNNMPAYQDVYAWRRTA